MADQGNNSQGESRGDSDPSIGGNSHAGSVQGPQNPNANPILIPK